MTYVLTDMWVIRFGPGQIKTEFSIHGPEWSVLHVDSIVLISVNKCELFYLLKMHSLFNKKLERHADSYYWTEQWYYQNIELFNAYFNQRELLTQPLNEWENVCLVMNTLSFVWYISLSGAIVALNEEIGKLIYK